jgi:hypothetical protein
VPHRVRAPMRRWRLARMKASAFGRRGRTSRLATSPLAARSLHRVPQRLRRARVTRTSRWG